MGVAIDQTGKYHPSFAVDFFYLSPVLVEPGMAEQLSLPACSDDLSGATQNGGIFDQTDFFECLPATRVILAAHGHELADVGE
jgi:hypothetical protein